MARMPSISALGATQNGADGVVLTVAGLCFNFPQQQLFDNLQVSVLAGVTLVQGGDGSGKTTLVRLLAGDLPLQKGRLELMPPSMGGIALNAQSGARQAKAYRKQVFWIDPRTTEFDQISPRTYFAQQGLAWPDFDQTRLPKLIEGLSLAEFMDKPLYMLSTGSKRKVWLAAAFASNATLALLDDPFAALDKPSIRCVTEVLNGLAQQSKRAVVMTGYASPEGVALAGVIDLGG